MDRLPDLCQRLVWELLPHSDRVSLLHLNRDWLHFAAGELYRDPFSTLRKIESRSNSLLDTQQARERSLQILRLLLQCCQKDFLLPTSSSTNLVTLPPPTIDYLACYTDQSTRYLLAVKDAWEVPAAVQGLPAKTIATANYNSNNYEYIRVAFATHRPETVTKLYTSMQSLVQLQEYAPRYERLHRLELYPNLKDLEDDGPLEAFIQARQSNSNIAHPPELVLLGGRTWTPAQRSMTLQTWSHLSHLDMMHWKGMVQWKHLPRKQLLELRVDLQSLSGDFDAEVFFCECTHLKSLWIFGLQTTTFEWLAKEMTPENGARDSGYGSEGGWRPKWTTLSVGGTSDALATSLKILLESCFTTLQTLMISLKSDGRIPYIAQKITWTTQLPSLTHIRIQDKAVFEFDPTALQRCPSLKSLHIGVRAEQKWPGCRYHDTPAYLKWWSNTAVFVSLGMMAPPTLEDLTLEGTWLFQPDFLISALVPLKHLKRVYFDHMMRVMTMDLEPVEVALRGFRWRSGEGESRQSYREFIRQEIPDLELHFLQPTYFNALDNAEWDVFE